MEQNNLTESMIARAYVGLTAMEALGFQSAPESFIPAKLRAIKPTGGTAFRDSLLTGIGLMLQLNALLQKLKMGAAWNFVHIVITDGADCNSKSTLEECLKLMYVIGQTIPQNCLKTYFIGIGIAEKEEKQLKALAALGGNTAQYINIKQGVMLSQIFAQISVSLGIQRRAQVLGIKTNKGNVFAYKQQVNPFLMLKELNYAVLFNIDMSGSMYSNWGSVCNSVTTFIQYLGSKDLVSGIVFNDKVTLLKQEPEANYQSTNSNRQLKSEANYQSAANTNPQLTEAQINVIKKKCYKCCCGLVCIALLIMMIVLLTKKK